LVEEQTGDECPQAGFEVGVVSLVESGLDDAPVVLR
jgi:hypothetical protein